MAVSGAGGDDPLQAPAASTEQEITARRSAARALPANPGAIAVDWVLDMSIIVVGSLFTAVSSHADAPATRSWADDGTNT